jgi:hypothetical protein
MNINTQLEVTQLEVILFANQVRLGVTKTAPLDKATEVGT